MDVGNNSLSNVTLCTEREKIICTLSRAFYALMQMKNSKFAQRLRVSWCTTGHFGFFLKKKKRGTRSIATQVVELRKKSTISYVMYTFLSLTDSKTEYYLQWHNRIVIITMKNDTIHLRQWFSSRNNCLKMQKKKRYVKGHLQREFESQLLKHPLLMKTEAIRCFRLKLYANQ